ncbi:MAG: HesA/MoeB/ThiF family protein [Clostridiaceae bacterium]|nr:HesA/MoeB/ThiF family protein [Clostridiaceae bacterium]
MLDSNQQLRYSRQIILKDIGYKGQEKLLKSKALVIGSGGLGSPVLYYLAAAGVGTLGIADFDTVSISNLQRQILHFTRDIGRKKVDSAEEKIKNLNPDVKVIKYPYRINAENIEEIIQDYDVIIDAVDNFTARYLISDCCYFMKKPLIEGAVVGFEGILMTIFPGESPCYRCLYPEPPQSGTIPTCVDMGILGAVAGTIGALQALEAIKVLLNIGNTLSGRILSFDGLNLNIREIPWKKRKTCPLCGENPVIKELQEYEIKCKLKH